MHVRFVAIHIQAFLDLGVSKRRLDGAKTILDQTPRPGVLEMLGFSSDRPFLEEQAWRVRVGLRHVIGAYGTSPLVVAEFYGTSSLSFIPDESLSFWLVLLLPIPFLVCPPSLPFWVSFIRSAVALGFSTEHPVLVLGSCIFGHPLVTRSGWSCCARVGSFWPFPYWCVGSDHTGTLVQY